MTHAGMRRRMGMAADATDAEEWGSGSRTGWQRVDAVDAEGFAGDDDDPGRAGELECARPDGWSAGGLKKRHRDGGRRGGGRGEGGRGGAPRQGRAREEGEETGSSSAGASGGRRRWVPRR